jgi:hypothetical protein
MAMVKQAASVALPQPVPTGRAGGVSARGSLPDEGEAASAASESGAVLPSSFFFNMGFI